MSVSHGVVVGGWEEVVVWLVGGLQCHSVSQSCDDCDDYNMQQIANSPISSHELVNENLNVQRKNKKLEKESKRIGGRVLSHQFDLGIWEWTRPTGCTAAHDYFHIHLFETGQNVTIDRRRKLKTKEILTDFIDQGTHTPIFNFPAQVQNAE